MNTKTVYKIAAETSKNYWQHSKPYNSFEDLMKDFGHWLATCKNINVRFYQEQVMIPE